MSVETVRILVGMIALPLIILPFWRIFSKAGFSGWLSLVMIVPFINFAVLYYVAFSKWKPPLGDSNSLPK
jgi:hypothetical protein